MAKRFHDNEIWDEDWFIALPRDYRDFWFWVKDKCDHAGVYKPNLATFNKLHDSSAEADKAIQLFNQDRKEDDKRIIVLPNGRWFLTQFIPFQYGHILNLQNPLHKSIYKILLENNVPLESIRPQIEVKETSRRPLQDLSETSSRPLGEDTQRLKDKDKVKDKDINTTIQHFFNYFISKTQKALKLTPERRAIIDKRLQEGRSLEELKKAVDNFTRDEWPDRHKFIDIVYCVGVRNKVDNLDKWLSMKPKKTEPQPKSDCTVCNGTGKVQREGPQKGARCFCY